MQISKITDVLLHLGVGKSSYIPGTLGSLLAVVLFYYLLEYIKNIYVMTIMIVLPLSLFVVGSYLSDLYIRRTGKEDPKEIVIDEFVGQSLVILSALYFIIDQKLVIQLGFSSIYNPYSYFLLILSFVLFRFFDIKKPYLIGYVDSNVKGGIGVMLDDIIAAFYAIMLLQTVNIVFLASYL